jgi:thiol-disulfide isomerase/thioredoxin
MRRYLIALAACITSSGTRAEDILNLGDPAPPMAVSSWVKGEKVDKFEPGKTYVIEFWATWCGPCRVSIPHLTELAHRYKHVRVRFVGVNVREQDNSRVKPFVEEMGDKLDYSVALDGLPTEGDTAEGTMARTWMRAAEALGIPTAFVVHDGKIAWIGHPTELDAPLARIVAGDWDAGEMAARRLQVKTKERRVRAIHERGGVIRDKVFRLYDSGEYRAAAAALDEATRGDPELTEEFAWLRFAALCNGGDVESGLVLGAKLFEMNKDDPKALNDCFCNVLNPKRRDGPDPRVARLALDAARRAVELSKGENAAYLDTLAAAQYRTGDVNAAAATEERALRRAEVEIERRSDPYYKPLNDRYLRLFHDQLERYRKTLKEKGDRP